MPAKKWTELESTVPDSGENTLSYPLSELILKYGDSELYKIPSDGPMVPIKILLNAQSNLKEVISHPDKIREKLRIQFEGQAVSDWRLNYEILSLEKDLKLVEDTIDAERNRVSGMDPIKADEVKELLINQGAAIDPNYNAWNDGPYAVYYAGRFAIWDGPTRRVEFSDGTEPFAIHKGEAVVFHTGGGLKPPKTEDFTTLSVVDRRFDPTFVTEQSEIPKISPRSIMASQPVISPKLLSLEL